MARQWLGIVMILSAGACEHGSQTIRSSEPTSRNAGGVGMAPSGDPPLAPSADRADVTVAPPPKPAPRPGAFANTDPDDDFVPGPPDPIEDCEGDLLRAGVTYRSAKLPVHETKKKVTCGAPQVVIYVRGPGGIAYSSPPLLTCKMALALAWFERIAQDEAASIFASRIARIEHLGTYSCREMAAYPGWISEHSYANAIDLSRFVLKNGRAIDVLSDFDTGEAPPKKPGGAFLRVVSRRANDEDVFSHVLTPFFDARHRNHFHLDLSRYRTDGTRPQP